MNKCTLWFTYHTDLPVVASQWVVPLLPGAPLLLEAEMKLSPQKPRERFTAREERYPLWFLPDTMWHLWVIV